MEDSDRAQGDGKMAGASAVIAEDAPVLEASDDVLDAGSAAAVATPSTVTQDAVPAKARRDELGNTAVATIGEDAPVLLAERRNRGFSIVHRIVAIAWTARGGGDDPQIAPTREDLCVARPTVVLRACGAAVVAGRDEGSVDDLGLAPVARLVVADERGQPRCHRGDDAMRSRLRDGEDGGKLAHGEVGAQRRARDEQALAQRPRPRATASRFGA